MRSHSIIAIALAGTLAVACAGKKKGTDDLTPRTYDLPEMDEEDLKDLPEAGR